MSLKQTERGGEGESTNKVTAAVVETLPLQNWSYLYTWCNIYTNTIPVE